MAQNDITEKSLASLNDVFSDIVNNLLFDGTARISQDSLRDARTHEPYRANSKRVRDQERDICKVWLLEGDGYTIRLAYLGIENETEPENDMPFRVIGYDGASYRNQIYTYKDAEGKEHRSTERYPVITLVLYFGYKEHWNAAKSLYDTYTSKVPDYLKEYVNDYPINLFEIAWLTDEQVAGFKSDFREVADYFTQMRKNNNYVPSERQIIHVREMLDLMAVLTGDDRFTEHVDELEKSKEGVTMCKVLDEVESKGVNRGIGIGEQKATNLINYLWENGRSEDAKKAANDKDFFNKLMSELTPVLNPAK